MRAIFFIVLGVSVSLASDALSDNKTGLMWQDNSAAKHIKKIGKGHWIFVVHCVWQGMMTGDFQALKN